MGEVSQAPEIEWVSNSGHAARVLRLRRFRVTQLVLLGVVVVGFTSLALFGRGASGPAVSAVVAVTFVSLALLGGLFPLSFPKYVSDRAFTSPLRVGFSGDGIHVEYDPRESAALAQVDWARPTILWAEVSAVETPEAFWGLPNQVLLTSKGSSGIQWRVVGLDPALAARIIARWKSRAAPLAE